VQCSADLVSVSDLSRSSMTNRARNGLGRVGR
jgi:hypothetical protein